MNYKQFNYMLTLAGEGSFSKAGDELCLTGKQLLCGGKTENSLKILRLFLCLER